MVEEETAYRISASLFGKTAGVDGYDLAVIGGELVVRY
jgi:hypothetical protein